MAKKQVAVTLRKPPPPVSADGFVVGKGGAEAAGAAPPVPPAVVAAPPPAVFAAPPPAVFAAPPPAVFAAPVAETPRVAPSGAVADEVIARPDGRSYREVTLYLPADLARKLTLHCMETNRDVSHVLADLVTKHLAEPSAPEASRLRAALDWGREIVSLLRKQHLAWLPV